MRHTIHTTQVYTLFGGAYLPEQHGYSDSSLCEARTGAGTKWAMMIGALLIGATATALATSAPSRIRASADGPGSLSVLPNVPGMIGFADAIY